MFTGIVEGLGTIAETRPEGGDLRLYVRTGSLDLNDVKLGDSIAINGVCLTAVQLPGDGFWADVSRETLAHTYFDQLNPGDLVNVEKALTPSSRLGGHLVSGHVDGTGTIAEMRIDGRSTRIRIQAPNAISRYIATKGSICIDGISLTVNAVDGDFFELNIVPHTLDQTLIKYYSVGRTVNIEVDQIARYLERLIQHSTQANSSSDNPPDNELTHSASADGLSLAFLQQHGFHGRR